jgi:DNA-binding NarL/FixJ family response regulator
MKNMPRIEGPVARGGENELSLCAPVDVMLVDNRTVVRAGLCALIERQPDLVVVAQAASLGDAASFDIAPDVIVTDIDLPDAQHGDVIHGLRALFPRSSILVLTVVDHPAKVQSVLAAGADGYLLQTVAGTDLLAGIRALAAGETFLQPSLGVELARWQRPRDTTLTLSPKEEEVLRLLALGHTNAEIARLNGVSLRTVEAHRSRIHQKLGPHTRAELVHYAQQAGLCA